MVRDPNVNDLNSKRWLQSLARKVATYLGRSRASGIKLHSSRRFRAHETDTRGWYVELGRLPGRSHDALQLWLDEYWNLSTPHLSVTFECRASSRASRIAEAGSPLFGKAKEIEDDDWQRVRQGRRSFGQLKRPLPTRLIERPLVELYRAYQYYTIVLRVSRLLTRTPSLRLVHRIGEFFADIAGANAGYPRLEQATENRRWLRQHVVRERSQRLALSARVRDGYTCSACGINFGILYGPLGEGYAQVHHVAPLHRRAGTVRTRVEDLVTVCANCHAMLHRLPGKTKTIASLQRHITGRWPRRADGSRATKHVRHGDLR